MALLNQSLLENLGINLSEQDYALLSEHFETTLRERVINEITFELTPDQARELASLQQASDDDLIAWLTANVPDLADIVADEVDILLGELAENGQAISDPSA
jgi:succinate dehydrogenase flavin-adding protein (antitoxin of CptAB toxin-antitoxin module)